MKHNKTQNQVITPAIWIVGNEPAAQPAAIVPSAGAALARPALLSLLYSNGALELVTESLDALDCGLLTILAAQTLQHPLRWVEPLKRVGRFVQIAYEPIGYPDPDMVIFLGPSNPAFQTAMREFQRVRFKQPPTWGGWPKWYQATMEAARTLIAPLQALQPTEQEALFVMRWAALVASTGDQSGWGGGL